jgi:hydrogenase-4 component F
MTLLLWLPVLAPALLGAAVTWRHADRWARLAPLASAVVIFVCGVSLLASGQVTASSVLRADVVAAYVLLCIGAVAIVALWAGLTSPGHGAVAGRADALICVFLAAMSLAVLSDNLGVMWVAVEATTIATAFLVGQRGTRKAIEAAWKYVVLGSVGVAIAFLGIVLIYAATPTGQAATLSWVALTSSDHLLNPAVARIGIALAVLGFATKAGLAPMHSWLPDAHSQAPAPVSGLMSGVLLSVAMYAIVRIQSLGVLYAGAALVRGLLITGGLLSLAVAAMLMLTQKDYKRLLAYSSIEHMGIIALGVGSGSTLGLVAALVHVLGHGVVKAAMFVVAGRVLSETGSSRIEDVSGLLQRRPDLGWPFLAGTAALLGFPPFVTFFTEVAIVVALATAGLPWVAAGAAVLLLVSFAGIARQVLAMTVGAPRTEHAAEDTADEPMDRRATWRGTLPVAIGIGLCAVASLLAVPLAPVLLAAAAALGVTP